MPGPDALGHVTAVLGERIDALSGGVTEQRLGLGRELGGFGLIQIPHSRRHRVDVASRHLAGGERVFEAGHRRAHLLTLGRGFRLLGRLLAVASQRTRRIGRSTLLGQPTLRASRAHLFGVEPGPQYGEPTDVGGQTVRVEHIGIGVAHFGVHRIGRMSHVISDRFESEVGDSEESIGKSEARL
ncbi:hypothetical protein [Ilumatobacter sp.]|uniref:hypothetical protein n=1 Tax=Ilumatobacter sp. TaxID=1967498 RepID=UPI00345CF241